MAVKIEKGGWILIFLIGAALVGYTLNKYGLIERIMPSAQVRESSVPKRADPEWTPRNAHGEQADALTLRAALLESNNAAAADLQQLVGSRPVLRLASDAGLGNLPDVRMLVWAWNAQMGAMFANGGPRATSGSLTCQHNVNLQFVREDDPGKMQEALIAFATDLKGGVRNPSKGAHFVAIMGDGSASFLKGVNDALRRLGSDYTAKVVGSAGYSRGEDKFMGPQAWKTNPSSSRGGLVSGYLRDGDWNIAQKWLGDNGLCNNPDEKTYDPSYRRSGKLP